jgi:uncharacterized damage-inducible protein DinB
VQAPSTKPTEDAAVSIDLQDKQAITRAFTAQAVDFLVGHYLPKIERCLENLNDEQIWWRPNQASNSIGNLVLHLCGNATQWIVAGLGGASDTRTRDVEFSQTGAIPRNELIDCLQSTVARVEAVLNTLDPATILEQRFIQGKQVEVLSAVFHVTEHFSMHTGQIILLTKMLTNQDLAFYDFSTGVPVHRWLRD